MSDREADTETFEATPEAVAKFPTIHAAIMDYSGMLSIELTQAGLTERQALSVVAHIMLDAAWGTAALGALIEDEEPRPTVFIASAQRAIDRLDVATIRKRMEGVKG